MSDIIPASQTVIENAANTPAIEGALIDNIASVDDARDAISFAARQLFGRMITQAEFIALSGFWNLDAAEEEGYNLTRLVTEVIERMKRKATVHAMMNQYTTMAGVPVGMIPMALNAPLPPEAYKEIPYGSMKGKTDIIPSYVRDRFDEVFGPQGYGWRITPETTSGKIEVVEAEKTSKGQNARTYIEHTVRMINYTFWYKVIAPDGYEQWLEASTFSDASGNEDAGYAFRGTWSSLLKQIHRSFGGTNHVLYDQFTHADASAMMNNRR